MMRNRPKKNHIWPYHGDPHLNLDMGKVRAFHYFRPAESGRMDFHPDEPLRFDDIEIRVIDRFRGDLEFLVILVLWWLAGKTIDASSLKVELNACPKG
jgi:hypothetical protein